MKRTLVIGGGGFIGSHLAEALRMKGHHVTVFDSFEYCYPDNLDNLRKAESVRIVKGDARELDPFLFDEEPFDEIYNLSGVVATKDFTSKPLEAFWVSALSADSMMRYQQVHKKVRLLFLSSSEVYGNAEVIPTDESYPGYVFCDGPRSGYDEGKRAAEAIIAGYQRTEEGQCVRIRLFNTYGPRMTANGRLVPTMIRDALVTSEITVAAPGTQKRTMLYVSDCVEALLLAMDYQPQVPVNVGGVETFSVYNIAVMIARMVTRSTARMTHVKVGDPWPGDIMDRKPDITKANVMFGWEPKVLFEHGLVKTFQYWRGRIKATKEFLDELG